MSTPAGTALKKASKSEPKAAQSKAAAPTVERDAAGSEKPSDAVAASRPAGVELSEDGPVPEGVRTLLAIYAESLASVEFPDVSAAILDQAAADLIDREQALQAAQRAVADADEAVRAARAALLDLSERGLAYARIFASKDAALSERLASIHLAAGKPRGRKPRATAARPAPADARSTAPEPLPTPPEIAPPEIANA